MHCVHASTSAQRGPHAAPHGTPKRPPRTLLWGACAALWVGALAYDARQRFLHATTPGEYGSTPVHFPEGSQLPHAAGRSLLAMFVHPECPCTRASLHELASVLEAHHTEDVLVVVERTLGERPLTADSPLARFAARHPAVVLQDDDGAEAQRFGALTSGYVVAYDAQGALRFAGGVTGSRGHEGDNVGARRLGAALGGVRAPSLIHDVFGCALEDRGGAP